MVEFTVRQTVRCGETTCATEPGVFCPWLGSASFGQMAVCILFDERLHEHEHGDKAGWLARGRACLAAEAAAKREEG